MNKQIRQCAFNVVAFDGTNTNALNGFPVNVSLFTGSLLYEPYFYTGSAYDQAISGKLRSQLGGYRFSASLAWERLLNTAPLLDVLNNAYTTTNAEITIQFHPDATNTTFYENVVVQNLSYNSAISGTIVSQPITVQLMGKEVRATIPDFYDL